jgi:uncharacterized membrane protein YtjA (UPF0391 family)
MAGTAAFFRNLAIADFRSSGTKHPPSRSIARHVEPDMFKWAVIFLIIALVAGALGLTNLSALAKRISMILFALFFLLAAIVFGIAFLVGDALIN